MSFESSFDRQFEREQRRQNEQLVRRLEKAAARNTPSLDEFKGSGMHPNVERDKRYVEGTESRFTEESGYHAKGLELLIQYGIAQGRLLSDPSREPTYLTEPIWTTRYDDIKNRVDAAATVHASPESNSANEEAELTFGIDLTTNPDQSVIRQKLLVGSNDPNIDLPAGFTQIEYYKNNDCRHDKKACVPRYCIGISSDSVDDYLSTVRPDRNGISQISPRASLIPSFKILYEMSQQNALFEKPLYDKVDNNEASEEEQEALHQMELLDNIYLKELDRLAKRLPPWANADCITKAGTYDIDKIAKKFMTGDTRDETFASIVETTRALEDEYSNSDNGDGSPDTDYLKKAGDALRRRPRNNQAIGKRATTIGKRIAS